MAGFSPDLRGAQQRRLRGVSHGTLAAALLAAPIAAGAQGFAGTATVIHGSAAITIAGNVQTVSIPTSSPVTTINWTPTDTAIGGGAINFLPAGNTVSYVGASGAPTPYTVLNRIIPSDTTRSVAFNGAVTSTANTRVWFYSPGGLLIGASGSFDVGGLVLTTADPVADASGNFMANFDQFGVAGAVGGTSAITIQPGASIKALNPGQSNYIVAIAPQISQGGTIAVAGSVALVAAESASFAVDARGLFNIAITAGTTVASNTFVHTGSTGGPNAAAAGGVQRVYMVAVPKNNAIAMAIAAGGSIGFAVADAANLQGDDIVLSAGSNIADTGTGNPVVAGRAGIGTASLTVGAGAYTSNTYAVSTDLATVTDPAANIIFNSSLAVIAPQAVVNVATGTLSVAGSLVVDANASGVGTARTATIAVAPSATLVVGANAAALAANGDLTETANDTLTGNGGSASLQVSGTATIAGTALVSANGEWDSVGTNPGNLNTFGGTAQIAVSGGGLTVGGTLTASATANGNGSTAALISMQSGNGGIYATGGSAAVTVTGASARISAANGIAALTDTTSGINLSGNGGSANGGASLIEADAGGTIAVGQSGAITASADARPGDVTPLYSDGQGGNSYGGTAQIIANAGTITVAGATGVHAFADAIGGGAPALIGSGGNATGGTALIATQGDGGRITANTSGMADGESYSVVEANAEGGEASGTFSAGGNGIGGTATLATTGANQSITIDQGYQVLISAMGYGTVGAGLGGGSGTGGSAQLLADGGTIALTHTSLTMDASGVGGNDYVTGGAATGGTVRLAASNGGTANLAVSKTLNAFGSAGGGSSTGGNALGGNIFIDLGDNAITFFAPIASANSDTFDASALPGRNSSGTLGSAASAGGVRLTDLGSLAISDALSLAANTRLYVAAGGSIDVTGLINSYDSNAYLHLLADDLGTGVGTVTLATGTISMAGSAVDIYYNPASLGTPTDFTAGVAAGTLTAYQLIDTVTQLQAIGSHVGQNFALGRNIDASATQGLNGGAGFVPIGTAAMPFNGKFDGLTHTVNNLAINTPGANDVGLFGVVSGAGAGAVIIRNVGLTNATVVGATNVGGLIGAVLDSGCTTCATIAVSNSFTGGAITGTQGVGGLIGSAQAANPVTIADAHSDAAVGSAAATGDVGGLVGSAQAAITRSFATGTVTAGVGSNHVGGLVGNAAGGSITDAYATGALSVGAAGSDIGGLVGRNDVVITRAYAVGPITAPGGNAIGGLVGTNDTAGAIAESYASGVVNATGGTSVGGLVGANNGTVSNAYWDSFSTGQANGDGSGAGSVSNLSAVTSEQRDAENYAFGPSAYANLPAADWVYDNYNTRPVGAWEVPVAQFGVATVASAHQVQLIDKNMAGSYLVTQNIDMRGTGTTTDIWAPGGFMPLGGLHVDPPLTGTLAGAGHVLSNLTIAPDTNGYNLVGLVQQNEGTISDLGLANVAIMATEASGVGAIAGINAGQISDSFATGTITVMAAPARTIITGGLVGVNADGTRGGGVGSITQSYANVAISGGSAIGGLVGDNEGTISGAYANGAIGSAANTGGLVGKSLNAAGPTVTNSYWDTQATGQSAGCGAVGYAGACGGATGLTTAQTLQSASFTGFAIDTHGGQGLPWRQYEGQTTPLLTAFLTPITVQPDSLIVQYNATVPNLGVTTYGAQPALLFGTAQLSGLTQNAGSAYIYYTGGLYSNQLGYDLVPSGRPGSLLITRAPLTITYTATPTSSAYGNAIPPLSGTVGAQGLQGNDLLAAVIAGTAVFTTAANAQSPVGQYAILGSGLAGNTYNYTFNFLQAPANATALTISAASLSVTVAADAQSRSYGAANPALTYSETGLVNGDALTGSLATTATPASNVGVYAITQGTLAASSNYALNYVGANLTVTPANLTVTYTANPAMSVYGTVPTGLSGSVGAAGLVNGDTLGSVTSGAANFTTAATAQSNVGSYAITGSGLAANSGNYNFNFLQAPANATALTISAASLSVTVAADAQSRSYGAANPALTYSETGLVNGDTLTGSLATTATPASNVGLYAITQGTLAASSNYALNYIGANLTVTPANLTVTYTADTAHSFYGTAPTGLSGTTSAAGLVNGDTLTSVTSGAAMFTTPATAQSNVGLYPIIGAGLAGNSGNYNFAFVQAPTNATALKIGPVTLSVTVAADAQSRSYGAANPALTYSETGLVNGDTLTGSLATTATPASNVGVYAITQGTLAASSNYLFFYVGANLTVTPANLAVTYIANPTTSIYGTMPTGIAGTVGAAGLVNGDTLGSVTSGAPVFTTAATAQSNVGSYAIAGSGLAGNSGNYSFSFAQAPGNAAALTINPRAITVTADPQQSNLGAALPALTYVVTPTAGMTAALVNGDTLTGQLATPATAASPAGMYAILQGTLAATPNYQLNYVGNTLTIVGAAAAGTGGLLDIGNRIEANLVDQSDTLGRLERLQVVQDSLDFGPGLYPPQLVRNLIDDRPVTTPPPVTEPVTSNSNASLWGPGAP